MKPVVARTSRVVRRLSRRLAVFLLVLGVLVAGVHIHHRLFPLGLETLVRRHVYKRAILRPAVVDRWGTLMTRVLPLDDRHLAAGMTLAIGIFEQEDDGLHLCSRLEGLGFVHDLALHGHTLYAAAGGENLAWYDVRDPCNPRKRGEYFFGGYGFGILIRNEHLYLANRSGGLTVFRLEPDGTPVYERVRYGSVHTLNESGTGWMTNDVAGLGPLLAAADGERGLLLFDDQSPRDSGIHAYFPEELTTPPSARRNIDPPPLRIRTYRDYVYLALRERGVAVLEHAGGTLLWRTRLQPDDGEVLDLLVAGDTLFVPSTRGKIFAYDLRRDPAALTSLKRTYCTGDDRAIHSLGFRDPFLYVSAVGTGLFVFNRGVGDTPLFSWQPPPEFRDIERVGSRLVAALGSGGIGVYEEVAHALRLIAHHDLPSFTFDILALGGDRFAACADLAGTYVFTLDGQGIPQVDLRIPTPEHAFAAAFLPPDRLATADGVFGLLAYRLQQGPDGTVFHDGQEESLPAGYTMHVDAWQGEFIGANIAGRVQTFPETPADFLAPRPSRCLTGGVSPDGRAYALACKGNRIHLWFRETDGSVDASSFSHGSDVVSLLPDPPYLYVGGFPRSLTIYKFEKGKGTKERAFATRGTPHAIIRDQDRVLVAAGSAGVLQLARRQGVWSLEDVPVR